MSGEFNDATKHIYEQIRHAQLQLLERETIKLVAGAALEDIQGVCVEGCTCQAVGHVDFSVKFWVWVEYAENTIIVRSGWREFCPHVTANRGGLL